MNNISLIQDNYPTKPGYYLWRGAFTGEVSLLNVVEYLPMSKYGVNFDAYLGVSNLGGKNVGSLIGFFSEKLDFGYERTS